MGKHGSCPCFGARKEGTGPSEAPSVIGLPARSTGRCPIASRGQSRAEKSWLRSSLQCLAGQGAAESTRAHPEMECRSGGGREEYKMGIAHVRELCSHTALRQLQQKIHPCPREWHQGFSHTDGLSREAVTAERGQSSTWSVSDY